MRYPGGPSHSRAERPPHQLVSLICMIEKKAFAPSFCQSFVAFTVMNDSLCDTLTLTQDDGVETIRETWGGTRD